MVAAAGCSDLPGLILGRAYSPTAALAAVACIKLPFRHRPCQAELSGPIAGRASSPTAALVAAACARRPSRRLPCQAEVAGNALRTHVQAAQQLPSLAAHVWER
eukprot:188813-Chlamydomonas_euryale.AAC.3